MTASSKRSSFGEEMPRPGRVVERAKLRSAALVSEFRRHFSSYLFVRYPFEVERRKRLIIFHLLLSQARTRRGRIRSRSHRGKAKLLLCASSSLSARTARAACLVASLVKCVLAAEVIGPDCAGCGETARPLPSSPRPRWSYAVRILTRATTDK